MGTSREIFPDVEHCIPIGRPDIPAEMCICLSGYPSDFHFVGCLACRRFYEKNIGFRMAEKSNLALYASDVPVLCSARKPDVFPRFLISLDYSVHVSVLEFFD
jgi:hypothetical protein